MDHGIGLRRRVAQGALIASVAAALVPALAAAEPSRVSVYEFDPQNNEEGPYGVIAVEARQRDEVSHHIVVNPDGPATWVISDSAGISLAPTSDGDGYSQPDEQAQKCEQIDQLSMRCGAPQSYKRAVFEADGAAGPDLIDLRGEGRTLEGSAGGYGGDDRILGGTSSDYLSGGAGDDVLIGYLGNDVILGEGGNDVIRSRDGLTDQISCGRGNDRKEKAIMDRHDHRAKLSNGSFTFLGGPISC